MVEFALVAPLLFFLLFIIIELGILFWVNLTMQYAVREGARYAITGQSTYSSVDPVTQQHLRYSAMTDKIRDSSMGLYPRFCSDPAEATFGAGGETIVLQLNCSWPVVTPAWRLMTLLSPGNQVNPPGQYAFTVAATMRNEAF